MLVRWILLVISIFGYKIIFTRKKKQQNQKLFSQIDEFDADFMIEHSNHEVQDGSNTNVGDIGSSSNNMKGPIHVDSPQVDMQTLGENFVSKVRSEVDSVVTRVKTRL